MKHLLLLFGMSALFLGMAGRAAADVWLFPMFDGCRWRFPNLCEEWRHRCCCCDDYIPKCQPAVPPNPKGCIDDYCRKCCPKVPPVPKGCCDDYRPRCCPLYLWKPCEPWYTCGPPEVCGPCSDKRHK